MFWEKELNPQLRTQWKAAPSPNAAATIPIVSQN